LWKFHLIAAILAVLSLALPYQSYHSLFLSLTDPNFYGCWWLWGLSVTYYESEGINISFSLSQYFNLIVAAIFVAIAITLLAEALAEKKGETSLKDVNITLLFLGILYIGINIVVLISTIPTQFPTLITEIYPVGSIPAFFAGGISIFSGFLGFYYR
jgi:hypothetical protein